MFDRVKRCRRCQQLINTSAFPPRSSLCYGCKDGASNSVVKDSLTTQPGNTMRSELITQAKFAVIDTETTGLDVGKTDKLVEIAGVGFHIESDRYEEFQTFVNPVRAIPAAASAIHHLTSEDVQHAPRSDEAINLLNLTYTGCVYVAHNAAFDAAALGLAGRPWICTRRLARHLWPNAPSHSNQVLRYWLDLGVSVPDGLHPHRALYDAICTAELLKYEITALQDQHPDIKTIDSLIQFLQRPVLLPTVRFGKHKGKRWREMEVGFLDWILARDFDEDVKYTANYWRDRHTR